MRPSERLLIAVGTLITVLLFGAAPAYAHAALVRTEPGAGSVIGSAPRQVLLTFSEGVLLSDDSLRVLDPSGREVEVGGAHHAASGPDTAVVTLRPALARGTYTVAWKAVSADTHPVSGAFTFSLGAPSKTSAVLPRQQAGGGPAGALYGVGRWVAYGGFAVLVGTATFIMGCWARGSRLRVMQRLAVGGWTALTGSTIALLLLRGPYANGTGLATVFDLDGLREAVTTKPGEALIARLLLLAAAAAFLAVLFGGYARRQDPAERRDLGVGLGVSGAVIAVGIALTWSASEHASVGVQPSIAMPVDVAHLLAMAVWLGGLAALVTALYRTSGVEGEAVRRFSRIALASVCVLVASGVYQSWRQVGSFSALTGTSYGHLLLVKVTLVAALLGIAGFSRRWTGSLAQQPVARRTEAPGPRGGEPAAPVAGRGGRTAAARAPGVPHAADATDAAEAAETTDATDAVEHDAPDGAAATVHDPPPPADPRRAAQLARQRAALAAARTRKRRDADPASAGLRRSVLAEAAVAVVVLAVTTALSGTEPGRTALAAAGSSTPAATSSGPVAVSIPYDTGGAGGRGTVEVHLDPARTGSNTLHLILTDPSGRPVDVPEVDLAFTLRSRAIGPLAVPLRHLGAGEWAASGLQLPMPGQWQLAVTVRTSDIDEVTETRNVTIN